jgi:endonuclease/exonuclease/phosphatase family metal-dependent hydrolase
VLARRSTLRIVEERTRWFGETPDRPGTRLPGASFPRIATTVVAELLDGAALRFTSTHLDERSEERRRLSATQLLEWVAEHGGAHVLAGDFNAPPTSPLFAAFAAAGFRHAVAASAGGTVHHFTGRRDGRRLDHILVSREFEVVGAEVVYGEPGERLASDHWPVVAELRMR